MTLSPAARKALTVPRGRETPDDEAREYAYFRKNLSEPAREALDALSPAEDDKDGEPAEPSPSALRYCLVEDPDGDAPCLRLFKNPEALARRLAELDGSDVYVIPFFGVPLRFSTGPQRYLVLPDGVKAMVIPHIKGGACKVFDADLLEFETQDNFYLGPDELSDSSGFAEKMAAKKNAKAVDAEIVENDADDDDEEDDDESDPNYEP